MEDVNITALFVLLFQVSVTVEVRGKDMSYLKQTISLATLEKVTRPTQIIFIYFGNLEASVRNSQMNDPTRT